MMASARADRIGELVSRIGELETEHRGPDGRLLAAEGWPAGALCEYTRLVVALAAAARCQNTTSNTTSSE